MPKEDRYAGLRMPAAPVYSQLLSFERRVDAVMARRHIMVQECLRKNKTEASTLRIFVFSSVDDHDREGGESEGDGARATGETWTLHIQGRLLGGSEDAPLSENLSREPPLSTFIRRLEVDVGDDTGAGPSYPGAAGKVAWENSLEKDSRPIHGFEIKRHSVGRDVPITIRLYPSQTPERYRVSPEIAAVTGREEDTKAHVITGIWEYIKLNGLQSEDDPSTITCDSKLKAIVKQSKFKLPSLPEYIKKHVSHLPPIEMKYVVPGPSSRPPRKRQRGNNEGGVEDGGGAGLNGEHDVAHEYSTEAHCYDITVSLPLRGSTECQSYIDKFTHDNDIAAIDKELRDIVSKVAEHTRRRDFFLGFSESPHEFIRQLTLSQAKDLQIVNTQSTREVNVTRKSDFYRRKWVTDAALRFLAESKVGSDMPK